MSGTTDKSIYYKGALQLQSGSFAATKGPVISGDSDFTVPLSFVVLLDSQGLLAAPYCMACQKLIGCAG